MAKKIVEVANGLMVERGYSAFSYADISERIGISKASIHHHFPTKADLAVAVLKRHCETLRGAMHHLDTNVSDPLKRLRAYATYWEGCLRDRGESFCIAALLGAELPTLPATVQTEVSSHFKGFSAWLEGVLLEGVRKGTIHLRHPADVEAQILMATIHGAMLTARASGSCDAFRIVVQAVLDQIATT